MATKELTLGQRLSLLKKQQAAKQLEIDVALREQEVFAVAQFFLAAKEYFSAEILRGNTQELFIPVSTAGKDCDTMVRVCKALGLNREVRKFEFMEKSSDHYTAWLDFASWAKEEDLKPKWLFEFYEEKDGTAVFINSLTVISQV